MIRLVNYCMYTGNLLHGHFDGKEVANGAYNNFKHVYAPTGIFGAVTIFHSFSLIICRSLQGQHLNTLAR